MEIFENILDQAIEKLQKGTPLSEVLLQYPREKEQLKPLLEHTQLLLSIPKIPAPKPDMQRKYITSGIHARTWTSLLHISPWLNVSLGTLMAIAAIFSTSFAASRSLPGEMLFPVKRTAEKIQLQFAETDVEKATIQVGITKKRIAEAKQIFGQNQKNEKQELAALHELSKETEQTLKAVKTAAVTNAIHEKNHPIVASLEEISTEQNNLFNSINQDSNTLATNSSIETSKQTKAIKQLIEVIAATTDQTTLITLDPNPSSVLTSGIISIGTKNSLTIEKTTFVITAETVVQDIDGKTAQLPTQGTKATIQAIKDVQTGKLIAKTVTVEATIKITSTTPETVKTTTSTTPTSKIESAPEKQTNTITTIGTFIPEDPAPQFK